MSSRTLAFAGLSAIGILIYANLAYTADRVTCTAESSTVDRCRIEEPNVRQPATDYPGIRFRPGDSVTVSAGGCVQTGGKGKTWKRYVDPLGDNADRLYHGLIAIPGATAGLIRLAGILGPTRVLTIPTNVPVSGGLYLRLGYEDDHYEDNGYSSHDNGTSNQCKNSVNAWIELRIDHASSADSPPPAPFDLVWDTVDRNYLPLNPKWQAQRDQPGALPDLASCGAGRFLQWKNNRIDLGTPPCASASLDIDTPPGLPWHLNEVLCNTTDNGDKIHGHVNWGAAAYTGTLKFIDHSKPIDIHGINPENWFGDDDYNFALYDIPGNGGLVSANSGLDHLEFDSDETIDRFGSPWWNTAHQAVDDGNAAPIFDGKEAVVLGLRGLDCEHSCGAELHPVYAMAIHANAKSPDDDVWAIWARNWGDEGYCSQNQHYLSAPDNILVLTLPWRTGATSAVVTASEFKTNSAVVAGPWVSVQPGAGIDVAFQLADPAAGSLIDGALHLTWTGGPGLQVQSPAVRSKPLAIPATLKQSPSEARMAELIRTMSLTQQALFMRKYQKAIAGLPGTIRNQRTPRQLLTLPTRAVQPRPVVHTAPASDKLARDRALSTALCTALSGNLPGIVDGCRGIDTTPP
ncbi:MAG TPA: hypothetical protein VHN14_06975 [Kofleriaceae bacterium]|nr:hypothetical protein [Kofleriaceae bacterium]